MLLVILGAGASYDSLFPERDGAWRPPLANDLFAPRFYDLLRRRPGAVVIAERVISMRARGSTIEEALSELQGEVNDPLRARQILETQFYLQHLLWDCTGHWGPTDAGMTNYLTLINDIEGWRRSMGGRVTWVTFNYDRLLEDAMRIRFGRKFDQIDNYLEPEHRIIKVHGSCNWMQLTDVTTVEGQGLGIEDLLARAATMKRLDRFIVAGPGTYQYDLNGVVPAIAVPAEPKAQFAAPDAHMKLLAADLPEVQSVLAIGWRGADKHLVEFMRGAVRPETPVTVVTGQPTEGDYYGRQEVLDVVSAGIRWPTDAGFESAMAVRSGFTGFLHAGGPSDIRRFLSAIPK